METGVKERGVAQDNWRQLEDCRSGITAVEFQLKLAEVCNGIL